MPLSEEERLERRREANRRYRQTHKEKIAEYNKEYNKRYRLEHPNYHKEEAIKFYYNHKEEILEKRKKHYSENKEDILEKQKQYQKENPQTKKEWREKNKERLSEYNKIIHEKRKNTKIGRASKLLSSYVQKDKAYNRGECTLTKEWIVDNIFNKSCVYCGESDWHKLGCDRKDNSLPHTVDNVVPCCSSCNSKKGSLSYEEYLEKMLEKELES